MRIKDLYLILARICRIYEGAIALLYPPRVRVRATVKLSAVFQPFFHNESSITIGGYESAIAPR